MLSPCCCVTNHRHRDAIAHVGAARRREAASPMDCRRRRGSRGLIVLAGGLRILPEGQQSLRRRPGAQMSMPTPSPGIELLVQRVAAILGGEQRAAVRESEIVERAVVPVAEDDDRDHSGGVVAQVHSEDRAPSAACGQLGLIPRVGVGVARRIEEECLEVESGRNWAFSGRLNGVAPAALALALASNEAKPSTAVSWTVTQLTGHAVPGLCSVPGTPRRRRRAHFRPSPGR